MSETIMFTLVSRQPFSGLITLQGNALINHPRAPCVGSGGGGNLKPDRDSYFSDLSKPRMHWDRVVPLTASSIVPRQRVNLFTFWFPYLGLDRSSWRPSTQPSRFFSSHGNRKLSFVHRGFTMTENLTSSDSFEMINVREHERTKQPRLPS